MNEEKKKNLLIICLIIITLMLLTLVILLSTGVIKTSKNNEELNNNLPKNETIEEENNNINTNENNRDNNYVYDANYSYNNQYTESKRYTYNEPEGKKTIDRFGISVEFNYGTQYLKDLKVPYININSNDATNANNEIKQLYEEYAKTFDECAIEGENSGCSLILTYKTYKYDNILSIVIIHAKQATSQWVLSYKTYNFDITTGKKLTYNEILSKLGYEENNTLTKIKDNLKNKMEEIYTQDKIDLSTECQNNTSCYDKANQLVETSINDNSLLFFVNNEGELNLLLIAYYDGVQNGKEHHYLIEIDK